MNSIVKKRITLKEIANLAGVTVGTVSAALHGTGRISDQKRSEIRELADELNYQPNAVAQLLKRKRNNDIGLIIYEKSENVLGSGSFNNTIADFTNICEHDELKNHIEYFDPSLKNKSIPYLISNGIVGGILLAGNINNNMKKWITDNPEFPLVALEETAKYSVNSAIDKGIIQAVQYLAAMGHRKISFLSGPLIYPPHRLGMEGFRFATREFKINTNEGKWIQELKLESDLGAMQESVEACHSFFNSKEYPTAIITNDMRTARAAIYAAMSHNLSVPDDISIISLGACWEAEKSYPPITTIERNSYQVVKEGLSMLKRKLTGKTVLEKSVWVDPVMKVRQTVKNIH